MKRVEKLIDLLHDPVFTYQSCSAFRDGGIDYKVIFKILYGGHITPEECMKSPLYGTGFLLEERIKDEKLKILEKLYGRLVEITSEHVADMPDELFNELNEFFGGLL